MLIFETTVCCGNPEACVTNETFMGFVRHLALLLPGITSICLVHSMIVKPIIQVHYKLDDLVCVYEGSLQFQSDIILVPNEIKAECLKFHEALIRQQKVVKMI